MKARSLRGIVEPSVDDALAAVGDLSRLAAGAPVPTASVAERLACTERQVLAALRAGVLDGTVELVPAPGAPDDVLVRLTGHSTRRGR